MKVNCRVNRIENREVVGATVLKILGWWPFDFLEIVTDARWIDFSTTIMFMPALKVMLLAVLQAEPGLYGGLMVGLQQASEGDSRLFLSSWRAAHAMELLSAELIAVVQEVATEHSLPQEFIEALAVTE